MNTEYDILYSYSRQSLPDCLEDLTSEINIKLSQGWKTTGGVSIALASHGSCYAAQAIERNSSSEKEIYTEES